MTFKIRTNSTWFLITAAEAGASRDALQKLGRQHLATFGEPLDENEYQALKACGTAPTRDWGFKLHGQVVKPVRSPIPTAPLFVPDF